MVFRYSYLIIFIVICFSLPSQTTYFNWAKVFGNNAPDAGISVTKNVNGYIYTTGYFKGTIDFDPGPATHTLTTAGTLYDAFVLKMDTSGNFIWAKDIGGNYWTSGGAIDVDSQGKVYVSGFFYNTTDFDPGPGTYTLASNGAKDVFISKLDSDGNFLWAKTFGGIEDDEPVALKIDEHDNIYTTGSFRDNVQVNTQTVTTNLISSGIKDMFICRFDSTGNIRWAKSIGGVGDDIGNSVAIDKKGNCYIGGDFQSVCDFDPSAATYTLSSSGNTDFFVTKLDSLGNMLWAKKAGGVNYDQCTSLALDTADNVYALNIFTGVVDFDPSLSTYTLTTNNNSVDISILKLTSAGNFVWCKAFGGPLTDVGKSICIDGFQNLYVTGYYNISADFDPGVSTYTLNSTGGNDIYILKLSNQGNFKWAKSLGGTGNDYGISINVDEHETIYTTGFFTTQADFNQEAGVYNLSGFGDLDIFIHKMSQCQTIVSSVTTQSIACFGAGNGSSTITATGGAGISYTWNPGSVISSTISGLSPGIYSCSIANNCGNTATQTISISQPTSGISVLASASASLICSGESATLQASINGGTGAYSYTWNPGGLTTNSITVTPTNTITYTLTVNDENGCADSSSVTQNVNTCTNLELNTMDKNSVTVYPNPNSGVFTIQLNSNAKIIITNCLGEVIKCEEKNTGTHTIELNSTKGMYLLNVAFDQFQKNFKIISQ